MGILQYQFKVHPQQYAFIIQGDSKFWRVNQSYPLFATSLRFEVTGVVPPQPKKRSNYKIPRPPTNPALKAPSTIHIASPFQNVIDTAPLEGLEELEELDAEAVFTSVGQMGAVNSVPNSPAAHKTTPFVHPKPVCTVYSLIIY